MDKKMNPKIFNDLDRDFADSTNAEMKYDSAKQEFIISMIDYNKKLNALHFIKCLELDLKHPIKEIESKNPFIDLTGITEVVKISSKGKIKEFKIQFNCNSTLSIKCLDFYYEHYE